MQKIPTLYVRDTADRRYVMPVVQEGCEWVLAGEGTATRKYDGTCVLFDPDVEGAPEATVRELQGWWARRELKAGTLTPDYYITEEKDPNTGKTVGWEPADRSPFAKYLAEAVRNLTDGPREGTHELLGPKINRDPERMGRHVLIAHADAEVLPDAPREFEGLSRWLRDHEYEGIVWHWGQPDGSVKMAKLKRRDVRR